MRGAKPLCAPLLWGPEAPTAPRAGAPPRVPEVYAGLVAPATPDAGAPREHGFAMLGTRVTFPTQGKSPKVRQGLCPLESPGACSPPFSRSLRCAPTRAGLLSANTPDRFATLNLWANRSFFLPKLYRGSHFLLSNRGAVAAIRGLDTANRALTTNNDNQGVKTFFSLLIYTLFYIFLFYI